MTSKRLLPANLMSARHLDSQQAQDNNIAHPLKVGLAAFLAINALVVGATIGFTASFIGSAGISLMLQSQAFITTIATVPLLAYSVVQIYKLWRDNNLISKEGLFLIARLASILIFSVALPWTYQLLELVSSFIGPNL